MSQAIPYDAAVKVRAKLQDMLARAFEGLKQPIGEQETNMLRGEIRNIEKLLAWIDPPSTPAPEPAERQLSGPPNY